MAANDAPDNDHDFQNKGISNFSSAVSTANPATPSTSGNPQHGRDYTLDPDAVVFTNTLSNPGTTDLSDVLLQPINPSFGGFGAGGGADDDTRLPNNTKVTINLGGQQAVYTYTRTNSTDGKFTLDAPVQPAGGNPGIPSEAITIPTLPAGVPLNYTVTIDLPPGTELSTDLDYGFAVPIIAFVDGDDDGTPDSNENSNYTINQVYTGFVKITKDVDVFEPDGTTPRTGDPLPGDILQYTVNYRNISEPQVGTGNNLVLEGSSVTIDENGTLDAVEDITQPANNWALDNNIDGDLDTINIQGTATDNSANSVITYYTGATDPDEDTDFHSVGTLIPAGTTDPGETVTGYRVAVPLVSPSEDAFKFIFRRKVDEYDGLAQDIETLPANFDSTPFDP